MIVCLDVTSFAGLCPGASHYYGKFTTDSGRLELKHTMSKHEAERANARDPDNPSPYEENEITDRFPSECAIKESAEEVFAFLFDEDEDVLVMTDDINPHEVLACPCPEDHGKLNRLHYAAEALGWYVSPRDPDAKWQNPIMEAVAAAYEDTIKEYRA